MDFDKKIRKALGKTSSVFSTKPPKSLSSRGKKPSTKASTKIDNLLNVAKGSVFFPFTQPTVRSPKGRVIKGSMPTMNKVFKNVGVRMINKKSDWDNDGVPNWKDCQPKNPMRQDKRSKFYADVSLPQSEKTVTTDSLFTHSTFKDNQGSVVRLWKNPRHAEMFDGQYDFRQTKPIQHHMVEVTAPKEMETEDEYMEVQEKDKNKLKVRPIYVGNKFTPLTDEERQEEIRKFNEERKQLMDDDQEFLEEADLVPRMDGPGKMFEDKDKDGVIAAADNDDNNPDNPRGAHYSQRPDWKERKNIPQWLFKQLNEKQKKETILLLQKGKPVSAIVEKYNLENPWAKPQKSPIKFSKEQKIELLQDFYQKHNRNPTAKEITEMQDVPTYGAYRSEFGSWNKALEAAGLTPTSKIDRTILASEVILKENIPTTKQRQKIVYELPEVKQRRLQQGREYRARPEIKERRKEYEQTPERIIARRKFEESPERKQYKQEYQQRSKTKKLQRNYEKSEKRKQYKQEYYKDPKYLEQEKERWKERKEQLQEYYSRPEVKERKKEQKKKYYEKYKEKLTPKEEEYYKSINPELFEDIEKGKEEQKEYLKEYRKEHTEDIAIQRKQKEAEKQFEKEAEEEAVDDVLEEQQETIEEKSEELVGDKDGDGVSNVMDCDPEDSEKQGPLHTAKQVTVYHGTTEGAWKGIQKEGRMWSPAFFSLAKDAPLTIYSKYGKRDDTAISEFSGDKKYTEKVQKVQQQPGGTKPVILQTTVPRETVWMTMDESFNQKKLEKLGKSMEATETTDVEVEQDIPSSELKPVKYQKYLRRNIVSQPEFEEKSEEEVDYAFKKMYEDKDDDGVIAAADNDDENPDNPSGLHYKPAGLQRLTRYQEIPRRDVFGLESRRVIRTDIPAAEPITAPPPIPTTMRSPPVWREMLGMHNRDKFYGFMSRK